MSLKGFQNLIVWRKAHLFVLEIYKATKSFPDDEKFLLNSQIKRSASSICANIAEGHRKTQKEFARYLDIAQGSLEETKYHLILSKDLHYLTEIEFNQLFVLAEEIGKMLNGLQNKIRN